MKEFIRKSYKKYGPMWAHISPFGLILVYGALKICYTNPNIKLLGLWGSTWTRKGPKTQLFEFSHSGVAQRGTIFQDFTLWGP